MTTLLGSPSIESGSTTLVVPSQGNTIILFHQKLLHHISRFQRKLADIGISLRDPVALASPDTSAFAISFLATTFQRAILAPLDLAYKQEDFEFYREDQTVAVILVSRGAVAENGEAVRAARKRGLAIAEIYWNDKRLFLR